MPKPTPGRETVRPRLGHRGTQLDAAPAAETAKQHGKAGCHLVEHHCRGVVGIGRVEPVDERMPDLADGLLGLPDIEVEPGHAPQPKTVITRSRRPCRTSSSSVSGSIMATRTARSSGRPPAISVAA